MSRRKKRLYTWIIITLASSVLASLVTYYYMSTYKLASVCQVYEDKIIAYERDNSVEACVLTRDVNANDQVTEDDFERILLPQRAKSNALFSGVENKEYYKYKKNISSGSILYDSMVYGKDDIKDDLRKFEISSLVLPLSLEKGDYVDVRINFPSGLDYVVLSKKRLEDFARIDDEAGKREICLFYLDSEEILRLSSAIVDAYITDGAYLYTTVYISSDTQERAEVTYPCNEAVNDSIKSDPNVVSKAIEKLADKDRSGITSTAELQKEESDSALQQVDDEKSKPENDESEQVVISISDKDMDASNDIE